MARSLIPTRAPTLDLATARLGDIDLADITDVAKVTLDAGRSMTQQWTELEPLVRLLTRQVRQWLDANTVEGATLDIKASSTLLGLVADVVAKITKAANAVLKAGEGQSRLALLMSGGAPRRADTAQLNEKQLAAVVIEAARRMKNETGTCPVCSVDEPTETTAEPTP